MRSKAAWFQARNSVYSESSDLPPEHQPPRGARPLSTANDAGCINTLICPTSTEPSRIPSRCSWAEVCQWITNLAGGSSFRGTVGWLDVAPSIQNSLPLKRHKNGAQTSVHVVQPSMSVSARRSVELDDDTIVSEYEED